MPLLIRHRNKRRHTAEDEYEPLRVTDPADDDLEMAGSDVLETTVCDVIEWLEDAQERLDITDEPVVERVDTGSSVKATRVIFGLKNGRREIWLDGPVFMQPLPRIRDLEWKSSDIGIEFVRSAEGVEKAVLESNARRE